jgi:hypothetical protein
MHPSTAGYADLGLAQASGGGYVVFRALAGYDFDPLFFAQFGVQTRITYFTGDPRWVTPGFQFVPELGTRVLMHRSLFMPAGILGPGTEVGVRPIVGWDGVASSGVGQGNASTITFAYGTQLFARLIFQ